MQAKSISRVLAQFIFDLSYKDLPGNVIEMAKTRILNSLTACFAGLKMPWAQMALRSIEGSIGEATVIGQEQRYAVRDAAFVNSVMAHSVLQEDSLKEGGHPSTHVVPAGLAVAEEEAISGADLILAIVIGYELMNRITLGTPAEANKDGLLGGFRGSTIFGIFGTTTCAGKLMK